MSLKKRLFFYHILVCNARESSSNENKREGEKIVRHETPKGGNTELCFRPSAISRVTANMERKRPPRYTTAGAKCSTCKRCAFFAVAASSYSPYRVRLFRIALTYSLVQCSTKEDPEQILLR